MEIKIGKSKLTVHPKTFGDQLRRFSLMEAAQLDPLTEGDGIEAAIRNGFHRMTYPSLVACTSGKVPTEAECYDLPNDELETWLDAAREENPDWFPVVKAEADAEEEKKSDATQS
jgi:hypothetical protein